MHLLNKINCFLLCTLMFFICAGASAKPLRVFVSIAPERLFLQRLAGDSVQIGVLVQPGENPHTYEPTPRQITALAQADCYVRIGIPFEDAWMPRLRAANPNMDIIDLRAGIVPLTAHTHMEDEEHEDTDPHIWTNPLWVKRMGQYLRDYLVRRDPAGRAFYTARYATFAAELDALDREIRATLQKLPVRSFMVVHPAWGAFAAAYGLTQLAIEKQGKEPGARALGQLIDLARSQGIRVVFVQPQFDHKAAQRLAEAIGGRVEDLDPLSENYFVNLRHVARQIAGAYTP